MFLLAGKLFDRYAVLDFGEVLSPASDVPQS